MSDTKTIEVGGAVSGDDGETNRTTPTTPTPTSTSAILRGDTRMTVLPIRFERLWEFYKKQRALGWEPEEVRLGQDRKDWESLNADERYFVENVLGFFARGDGYVVANLMDQFVDEVKPLEAKYNFVYQAQIEQVHSEVYARLVDFYIGDAARRDALLARSGEIPAVRRKTDWIRTWMDPRNGTFGERLFAFAVVEGVLFSGSFCAIYWLKERGLMPGLAHANDLIARDEGMHTDFAVLLNEHLAAPERATTARAHAIMRGAVETEKSFILDSIPCRLVGMNHGLMARYIEFVADRLLVQFGHPPLYRSKNPFEFMERISMRAKKNFFEGEVAEYGKANVGLNEGDMEVAFTDDF